MAIVKGWDWEKGKSPQWLQPCEQSYFYSQKWQSEGRRSVLDLGSGLGRHSIFFAKSGFKVTAVDISEYGIDYLKEWQKQEGVDIRTVRCDFESLPFSDNAFDCLFAYHAISHTDTNGFRKILLEIQRVMKPNGSVFLTLCSKESPRFHRGYPVVDENTVIEMEEGPEKGVAHFHVDLQDILREFKDFEIQTINEIDYCFYNGKTQSNKHYYMEAGINKPLVEIDYSDVLGRQVNVVIDRPMGSDHPRCAIHYTVNYGYIPGVMGGDNSEQDIYLLGVNKPVSEFEGVVIAVIHRLNDIEDKWIVAPEGVRFAKEEILQQVDFVERFYDVEIYQ